MNNKYTITVSDPLLRPGLTLSVSVSEKYVEEATKELMGKVRDINAANDEKIKVSFYHGPPDIDPYRKGSPVIETDSAGNAKEKQDEDGADENGIVNVEFEQWLKRKNKST